MTMLQKELFTGNQSKLAKKVLRPPTSNTSRPRAIISPMIDPNITSIRPTGVQTITKRMNMDEKAVPWIKYFAKFFQFNYFTS